MRALLAGLMVLATAGAAVAQDVSVPVPVGGTAGPACGATGVASAAVPVHVGPGTEYEAYDQLKPGQTVFLCSRVGRNWFGIVYGEADCGVGKQIAERITYIGGCRTGWVPTRGMTVAEQ